MKYVLLLLALLAGFIVMLLALNANAAGAVTEPIAGRITQSDSR